MSKINCVVPTEQDLRAEDVNIADVSRRKKKKKKKRAIIQNTPREITRSPATTRAHGKKEPFVQKGH